MIEMCGGNLYPIPGVAKLSDYLKTITEVDTNSLIISSDSGQPRKSMPAEVLRVFTQCLMDKGVSQEQINTMTKINPIKLLDL
jgi:predicted metal-dependent phosphotriesterase family hydrolase